MRMSVELHKRRILLPVTFLLLHFANWPSLFGSMFVVPKCYREPFYKNK